MEGMLEKFQPETDSLWVPRAERLRPHIALLLDWDSEGLCSKAQLSLDGAMLSHPALARVCLETLAGFLNQTWSERSPELEPAFLLRDEQEQREYRHDGLVLLRDRQGARLRFTVRPESSFLSGWFRK